MQSSYAALAVVTSLSDTLCFARDSQSRSRANSSEVSAAAPDVSNVIFGHDIRSVGVEVIQEREERSVILPSGKPLQKVAVDLRCRLLRSRPPADGPGPDSRCCDPPNSEGLGHRNDLILVVKIVIVGKASSRVRTKSCRSKCWRRTRLCDTPYRGGIPRGSGPLGPAADSQTHPSGAATVR